MGKRIFLFAPIVLIAVLLVGTLVAWRWWTGAIAAPSTQEADKIFVIQPGEPITSIGKRLYADGLIKSPLAFRLYLQKSGVGKKIQAGDFRLRPNMTLPVLVTELQHGQLDKWMTLLEGWRVEEMAEEVARTFDVTEEEFLTYAKEGYMFPDTYLLPKEFTAASISAKLRSTFEEKINDDMLRDIKEQGWTLDEIVILASLIERETQKDPDRAIVAGILRNRLEIGMPLQVDATVQYALGHQSGEQESPWWKQDLTIEDLAVDSAYNTYIYNGLPPAPICNPGLAALTAAIYPEETDYLYYVHDKEGNIYYAQTNEEHEQNKDNIGL